MKYTLRPYQQEAAESVLGPRVPGQNPMIVLPTGAGKSLVMAEIGSRVGGYVLGLQPSKLILEQNAAKFESYGIEPAVWSASFNRRERGQITLATIGSVADHLGEFQDVGTIIIDECHLVDSRDRFKKGKKQPPGEYRRLIESLPHAKVIGLTATPYRLASNSFGSELRFLTRTRPKVFTSVAYACQISDLTRNEHLAPLKYKAVKVLDEGKLKINSQGSDFTDKSVQLELFKTGFAARLVDGIKRLLDSGQEHIAVFTRFVEEAEYVARELGDLARVVSSDLTSSERDKILHQFRTGKVKVVTNVGVIGIGFDFPELDTVIVADATLSLAKWYQRVGRGMRPAEGKDRAIIVDMGGNLARFGRVEDMILKNSGNGKWAYWSNGRQLTNVLMPAPKAQRKRAQYFAAKGTTA